MNNTLNQHQESNRDCSAQVQRTRNSDQQPESQKHPQIEIESRLFTFYQDYSSLANGVTIAFKSKKKDSSYCLLVEGMEVKIIENQKIGFTMKLEKRKFMDVIYMDKTYFFYDFIKGIYRFDPEAQRIDFWADIKCSYNRGCNIKPGFQDRFLIANSENAHMSIVEVRQNGKKGRMLTLGIKSFKQDLITGIRTFGVLHTLSTVVVASNDAQLIFFKFFPKNFKMLKSRHKDLRGLIKYTKASPEMNNETISNMIVSADEKYLALMTETKIDHKTNQLLMFRVKPSTLDAEYYCKLDLQKYEMGQFNALNFFENYIQRDEGNCLIIGGCDSQWTNKVSFFSFNIETKEIVYLDGLAEKPYTSLAEMMIQLNGSLILCGCSGYVYQYLVKEL